MSTNKPATPLPWADAPNTGAVVSIATDMPRHVLRGHLREGAEQDLAYARIAANAYPKLVAALKESRRAHDQCEDCWYSCPKSPEGCCNELAGDDCTCGADEYNAGVDALLRELGEAG